MISIPVTALPTGYQKMGGIQGAYYSGYDQSCRPVDGCVTGIGEVVLVRTEADQGQRTTYKAYNYAVGCSGNSGALAIGPEQKLFSGHHYWTNEPPTHAFGHVQWESLPRIPGNTNG